VVNKLRPKTQEKILYALSDGKPQSFKELTQKLQLSSDVVESALSRMWRKFKILRSTKPIICTEQTFRGRAGKVSNLRQYYTYLIGSNDGKPVFLYGQQYVAFSQKYADKRGDIGETSKADTIRKFLYQNRDHAYFSKNVVDALKDKEVKPSDIMSTIRRLETKSRVYVRGYRLHDKQTPFKEGYLLTWIDENKPHDLCLLFFVVSLNYNFVFFDELFCFFSI
jgi:hypothetical protein